MEEIASKVSEKESIPLESDDNSKPSTNGKSNRNYSINLFPDSPVYEPDEDLNDVNIITISSDEKTQEPLVKDPLHAKRKLSNEMLENHPKILRLDSLEEFKLTQNLDDEVSSITAETKVKNKDLVLPSTSHVRSPARPSPRKITKRSNSTEVATPKTPTTKSRPASTDITRERKTPRKIEKNIFKNTGPVVEIISDDCKSQPSIDLKETSTSQTTFMPIAEENASELNDSQNIHLVLSPSPEDVSEDIKTNDISTSDPVVPKDRKEVLDPGKITQTRSEGYNYSDQSSNLSQIFKGGDYGKTTDQESTDSVHSISIDSPDHMPTAASKMISKLSNGNSSTPTEQSSGNKHVIRISENDSELTPDMLQLNGKKGKGKIESFRNSNQNTPSTISPMPNGNSLPMNSNTNTPHIPTFDIHVSHNEDGEFLSLNIVRTDSDLGMDMYKEYQRISKRFSTDSYLGDVSHTSTSPSSVTSTGMINLPNRTSYASTTTSTSSNRTSDGAFVVPQPPRKSVSHHSSISVKGWDFLLKIQDFLKKIQDIVGHLPDHHSMDLNRSVDDKISVGIQASPSSEAASLSNGNASPIEVSKCDKATPKSSLKKTKVRGRRPLSTKTKRAILPTQAEEPEYMQGMNSPEMLPSNSENGNMSPKSLKDEKPLSSLVATPRSVNKLKQKRSRPTSPRPATPVEKTLLKQDYQGFPPNTVVLAKWVDKRYYSGRLVEMTEPNKYLIKFDDGQSKSLLDDFIIFGDSKALPLGGQLVYAMVDDQQTFEPGLVLEVEENARGTVTYRCTTHGDTTVSVTASELYLTEDQARSIKESRAKSPHSAPTTPRRRGLRELDLDNIIQGPRSARSRDKGSSSGRKRVHSPKSPKASTSGLKSAKPTPLSRRRLASESSEMSESSNSAPPARLEEVAGVEPEVQKTPRKIDGVKAGPLQLKGATKQNIGKKNSKLAKFSDDADTISALGPVPVGGALFRGLAFLLTCTEPPSARQRHSTEKETRHYSSEEDGETSTSNVGTDTEDLEFSDKPFNKERLKDQLEAGGGTVYSHFDDVPKNKYSVCKLIAPRPCLTAKYIQCLASAIRCVSHAWVIACCSQGALLDADAFALPAGWAVLSRRFVNWTPPTGKRNTTFYNNKVVLLCSDQDSWLKFWERVCTLAGANTRVVNEEDLNMSGAIALVTEIDCPHEVQNKANQDNIPLVATTWVVQCLIEGRVLPPASHDKFSFSYTEEPE